MIYFISFSTSILFLYFILFLPFTRFHCFRLRFFIFFCIPFSYHFSSFLVLTFSHHPFPFLFSLLLLSYFLFLFFAHLLSPLSPLHSLSSPNADHHGTTLRPSHLSQSQSITLMNTFQSNNLTSPAPNTWIHLSLCNACPPIPSHLEHSIHVPNYICLFGPPGLPHTSYHTWHSNHVPRYTWACNTGPSKSPVTLHLTPPLYSQSRIYLARFHICPGIWTHLTLSLDTPPNTLANL